MTVKLGLTQTSQLANLLGFYDVAQKYRITFDNAVDDDFHVHTSNGEKRFAPNHKTKLYGYKPSKKYFEAVAQTKETDSNEHMQNHLVSTVSENCEGYTAREIEDAKRARDLYHVVGAPGIPNFKAAIRQKIIKNCPVTVEDIDRAEKIFGPKYCLPHSMLHFVSTYSF